MFHRIAHLLLVIMVGVLLGITTLATYAWYDYQASGPSTTVATVFLERGQGSAEIAVQLAGNGVIRNPLLFEAMAFIVGKAHRFKAGEYQFAAAMSPRQIMDIIAEGRVVVHKITIPEGLTVRDIVALLNHETMLSGDITGEIKDGQLLPETYNFLFGDKRQMIIDRMRAGMDKTISSLWARRKSGLPFKTPEEALTLASIVEKETGLAEERGHVASVFINRLRKGMRLQSDPTVKYAIEKDKGALGRLLLKTDLTYDSPYNTYVAIGLPPAPIANPGRASIEAVLNPTETGDYYFVATGSGGHNFSPTLAGHNKNVKEYRKKVAKRAP